MKMYPRLKSVYYFHFLNNMKIPNSNKLSPSYKIVDISCGIFLGDN